jgi:ABC-type uncharacterized transport system substrate-binding protein
MIFLAISLYAQSVLVLNSNSNIEKYKIVEDTFRNNFKNEYRYKDASKMSVNEVKNYLYDEYPDIVYAIGAKAYQYANNFIPEKTIFFSSIVNYKRLIKNSKQFGVSNELHAGMELTLLGSIFNNRKKIGIFYSEYTKDIFDNYKKQANQMGLDIGGYNISKKDNISKNFLETCDAILLIADPILLKNEQNVISIFEDMAKLKKPVVAYHELFIKYGASLVISTDHQTIGRQVASMVNMFINSNEFEKVQLPMGTNVILNKKQLDKLEIKYNNYALSVVNKIIE